MSYATSLQMAYPPPYGPSTLLSDDLVHRASVLPYYAPSSLPHRTGSHLLSDDFTYNPIGLAPSSYRSAAYQPFSAITDWQRDIPALTSYTPRNNVREYTGSMNTGSNTNTASTMAHSSRENNLYSSKNKVSINPNQSPNDADRQAPLTTTWSSRQSKKDEQPTVTYRSMPELSATKRQPKSPVEEIKKDPTPPPPHLPVLTKQESNTTTTTESEKQPEQPSAVVNHVTLTENRRDSLVDEQTAKQSWANKIDQLHTTQAQREKEKAKASRVLPYLPVKQFSQKPVVATDKKGRISPYQRRSSSYFDSLFDGNYYRKTSTNQQNSTSSFSPRNKPITNSPSKLKTTVVPKQTPPRKAVQYEPPSPLTNRTAPIPTTTLKKQEQNQSPNGSLTHRENIPKDTDERYREALQKFRADRAEQQQRELTESTAKRLNYGNYVRQSTKEGSLRNVVKPSPWVDFMDTKKGHVYIVEQEEKKDLYNQSRWYGERVRFRNFVLHNAGETAPMAHRPYLFPIETEHEHQSDEEAANSDKDSNSTLKSNRKKTATTNNVTSGRSSSSTRKKTATTNNATSGRSSNFNRKKTATTNNMTSGRSSSSNRASEDDDDENESTPNEKQRPYVSSVPTSSATEESDNDQTNEDDFLSTLREEKTLESFGSLRSKKH